MKKQMTYLLGLLVLIVWGMIIYRVFESFGGSDDRAETGPGNIKKEPFNDFAIKKDTTRLLLKYRDPFGLVAAKDTDEEFERKGPRQRTAIIVAKQVLNWNFIQYTGYIRNSKSKKMITLVVINGKNEMFAENEQKDQVTLLRNLRDSIKIRYAGEIKFIRLKRSTE